ncbi:MAG: lysophospholipid acyltransferase family protein [Candidatus Sumerlaeaceae bacterium]|nr:lysophospholipid acyltransferase family protein [Candidatus Sumerlaeaceae bacterium]
MSGRRPFRVWLRTASHGLVYHVVVPLVIVVIWLLRLTWRIRLVNADGRERKPVLFAIWHGDMLAAAAFFHLHLPGVDVVASRSREGQLIERFVNLYGAGCIRGGSSRGQVEALREIMRSVRAGRAVVVAVDGPRGPLGVAKSGVLLASGRTGVPVVPGAVAADRAWRFRSWDRTMIPKPFARVEVRYGVPIQVSENASREEIEAMRLALEEQLHALHRPIGAYQPAEKPCECQAARDEETVRDQ